MKKKVYIETSIVSYLTGKPSQNLLVAAWQSLTTEWWENRRDIFKLYTSELVIEEASCGDMKAAQKRLKALEGIPLLKLTDSAVELAKKLIANGVLPSKATDDAVHIALATVHGIDYLLTWNCRHINNAEIKPLVRTMIVSEGYKCPEICTPQELFGGEPNEE